MPSETYVRSKEEKWGDEDEVHTRDSNRILKSLVQDHALCHWIPNVFYKHVLAVSPLTETKSGEALCTFTVKAGHNYGVFSLYVM